jgi:hypothetical protein
MSGSSDRMLDLLQQLSVLNQLEGQSETDAKSGTALPDSKQRRQKIRAEMKQLASQARRKISK